MDDHLRYPLIMRAVIESPWAILPSKMADIMDFLAFKAAGGHLTAEEVAERLGAAPDRQRRQSSGSIAVMPVLGTISHRMNLLNASSGGTSVEGMAREFRALVNDPQIGAIVLDIDSPGGNVNGIDEFANEVYRARGRKPITAVANAMAASAAYWIATAADEIVVTPSAEVGSIGVLAAHEDRSALFEKMGVKTSLVSAGKYKAENNPFEPITEEGRSAIQKRVDEAYGRFTRAVARNRGVPVDTVRNGFGEGRVVGAREAVSLGMADRIATIDEVLSTIPANTVANTSGATAGLVAVPYQEHGQRVLADLTLFLQATRDRVEFRRAERGHVPLSAAERARLSEIDSQLQAISAELVAILTETDPSRPRLSTAEMLRLMANLQAVDLQLAGISD